MGNFAESIFAPTNFHLFFSVTTWQKPTEMAPRMKRAPVSSASASEDDEEDSASGSGSEVDVNGKANGKAGDDHEAIPAIDVDVTTLNPLSPIVIQKQATINIGGPLFQQAFQQKLMTVHWLV